MSTDRDERRLRTLANAHGERVLKSRAELGFQWGVVHVRYLLVDTSSGLPVAGGDCPSELQDRYSEFADGSAQT